MLKLSLSNMATGKAFTLPVGLKTVVNITVATISPVQLEAVDHNGEMQILFVFPAGTNTERLQVEGAKEIRLASKTPFGFQSSLSIRQNQEPLTQSPALPPREYPTMLAQIRAQARSAVGVRGYLIDDDEPDFPLVEHPQAAGTPQPAPPAANPEPPAPTPPEPTSTPPTNQNTTS